MSITKLYMKLVANTSEKNLAIELFNYCSSRKVFWKSVYYILAIIVIVLTLSYNFANVLWGGDNFCCKHYSGTPDADSPIPHLAKVRET